MRKTTTKRQFPINSKIVINILIIGGLIAVLASQHTALIASLRSVRQADVGLLLLAILAFIASEAPGALSYLSLALRPIPLGLTALAQLASGFTNRLLPAGLGSLGLFATYLHKQGHSTAEASAIVATNNILGFIGNALLVIGLLIVRPDYLSHLHIPHLPHLPHLHHPSDTSWTDGPLISWLIAAAVAGIVVVLIIYIRTHQGGIIRRFLASLGQALGRSLRPGKRTFLSLASNMLLTTLKSFVLALSAAAVGLTIGWPIALLVLSVGTLVGAAVPTPGGLGGVEAGLLAGLVAFGTPSAVGLTTVLVYRVLTYWLPIIPGVIALRALRSHVA